MQTVELLATWTPFLLEGFRWNILIAIVATAIGTALGGVFAVLRFSRRRGVKSSVEKITAFFRNVPTLVLMFYLAVIFPNEFTFGDNISVEFPSWVKASVALAASPLGFTSLNLHAAIIAWRAGDHDAALLFLPNWINGFVITTLASSVSSLVGVSELVGRCNTLINATGSSHMVPVYLYCAAIFFAFCSLSSFAVRILKAKIRRRLSVDA